MDLITRNPTLTGVVVGGAMIRPAPAALSMGGLSPDLHTLWICRVTLAPPIEDMPPELHPTLLTQQRVSPATA